MNLSINRLFRACIPLALFGALIISGTCFTAGSAELPGMITLDSIQKLYGPVKFDHAMHAGLAESCGKCHHQHNDRAVALCRECHILKPEVFRSSVQQGFLPCSGCHSEYSPDNPAMPGLKVAFHKKCFQCHIGIGQLGSSPKGCAEICHEKK
jgi:hypothetical protein